MKIDWLRPLLGRPGPFATVYLDATRANEAGDREVENRWQGVRRALSQEGAPADVLDDLEASVSKPTGLRGPHGRVLIADSTGQILVDRVLRQPPPQNVGVYGRVPALLQAAHASDECVNHVRVIVDRRGARFDWFMEDGHASGSQVVEGDHDVIAKAGAGGTAQGRSEARAEDSWERNAEVVAHELDRQVADQRPELILLSGDVRAMSLLRAELGKQAAALVVEVAGGSRAEGAHQGPYEGHIQDALDEFRVRRREGVLAEYRREHGRGASAVTSLEDVVAVLRRGQVQELILDESYGAEPNGSGASLWIGPDPLHIADRRSGIEDLGVDEPIEQLPAAAALVRAAVGQDAGLTFAPAGAVELIDGVGATLRWSDDSTPSEDATAMMRDPVRSRGA